MLVYRIQDAFGDGPYNNDGQVPGLGDAHTDGGIHPPPDMDGIEYSWDWDEYVCGFGSMPAMLWWFDGWLDKLHYHYHALTIWEVDEEYVREGRKQVMFNRDMADLIETVPLTALRQGAYELAA